MVAAGARPARADARASAPPAAELLTRGDRVRRALFSVFAGLTIGYTIFMAVLGDSDALRQQVLTAIGDSLPG